ncbi:hypothetical protein AQUCO_05600081v1 [Aquilegia coerulea]|uniref:Uncharacterized protein n=1 Tax=Aquilegia coerulea TaxID=218851 RepID=A0A2G5CGH4_AQUCA|nr:hypothetical protein AQUCO_05600081v1 [Aquilegia coerulea]
MVKRVKERTEQKKKEKEVIITEDEMDLGNEEEIKVPLADWKTTKYYQMLPREEQEVLDKYVNDVKDGSTMA